MTRTIRGHDKVYREDQAVPLIDALACFTIDGAWLTYDEDKRGSIEAGKYADLVVLDADLMSASEDEIRRMAENVLATLVGGQVVYRRSDSPLK